MRQFLLPLALAFIAASPSSSTAPATVVLIVRHAERAPGSGDPPLSDAGQARAGVLAEIGTLSAVSAIITTQFQRTRQTAAPLAESLGITPQVVTTRADLARHGNEIAAVVRQLAGKTILIVGHSNTVPGIVAALGGPRFHDLCETEYDRLITMVLDAEGGVRTVQTRFGTPTPVDSACAAMR